MKKTDKFHALIKFTFYYGKVWINKVSEVCAKQKLKSEEKGCVVLRKLKF